MNGHNNLSFPSSDSEDKNSLDENIIKEPKIEYPFKKIKYIPVTLSSTKEICFLYFPEKDYDYFSKQKLELDNLTFEEDRQFKEDIFNRFKDLYKNISLEQRLKKSYSSNMSKIKPNFSFSLVMNEQFKDSPFVRSQIKDYIFIKNDIMKHLDFEKEKMVSYDLFDHMKIKSNKNPNKKMLAKYAKSLLDKKKDNESSDEEDANDYKKSLIYEEEDEFLKSYKDIIKQLFKMNDVRKDLINYCLDNDHEFENNDFEKFVCYLEYFITLFTGIQIKYSIDELGLLNMDLYASEKIFMKMAEILHYIAQFQIKDKSYFKGEEEIYKSVELLIKLNNKQYENFDFDKLEYFPVYAPFMFPLKDNFRRYDENDNYHLCKECLIMGPDIKCNSSLFRFIDKTRLLYMTLLPIIDIGKIEKMIKSESNYINQIFKSAMYLRNEAVLNNLKDKEIITSYLSPIPTANSKRIDNIFKNTFGETIGYFYSWISHYLMWLLFPTSIGLILSILSWFIPENAIIYFDLIFLSIIILWGLYYTEDWNCLQMFYNHIWGINDFIGEKSNSYDENYYRGYFTNFLGIKMEKENYIKKLENSIISFFSIFFLSLVIILTNIVVFYIYKIENLQAYFIINYKYQVPILILIIREILSVYIYKITKILAHLENPTDKDKYLEIVTRKRLILEYVNYYFNLYYIAFYKKLVGKCYYDDCYSELNNQLLMILIADSILVLCRLCYKAFFLRNTKKRFESTLMKKYSHLESLKDPESTSIKFKIYTREEHHEENTQKIILPIIYHFGYVIQFGACFPISFLFLLILVIFCRVADAISMVDLLYVKTIEVSKGLKGYNRMQNRMLYIGTFTNIGIIYFTKGNNFSDEDITHALIITICIENGIFLFFKIFDFMHFPFWFRYKDKIILKYFKKFGIISRNKSDKF